MKKKNAVKKKKPVRYSVDNVEFTLNAFRKMLDRIEHENGKRITISFDAGYNNVDMVIIK